MCMCVCVCVCSSPLSPHLDPSLLPACLPLLFLTCCRRPRRLQVGRQRCGGQARQVVVQAGLTPRLVLLGVCDAFEQ
jgi:hypothetical protein